MEFKKNIHFKGLNGIRAICAFAVVISHASLSLLVIGLEPGKIFGLAAYGVTAFFALSGFLITYLLMEEKQAYEKVSVKKFYIRRILRIWPLYFGYMILAIISDIYIFNAGNFSSIGYYIFFFPNIPFSYEMAGMTTVVPIYLLGHFWSLGVEEQFYAFYPWLFRIFKNIFKVLLSMFFIVLILKLTAKYISYKTGNPFWYSWLDNTRFDAMACGGIGAYLLKYKYDWVVKLIKSKILHLITTAIIVLVFINKLAIPNSLSHIIVAVTTVVTIYYAHLLNKPYINLSNKYIDYLGKISFGVYVYHPLVIGYSALFFKNLHMPATVKTGLFFITVIVFTIGLSVLSYKYFENYFLKLKLNYAVVKNKD